jgi:hypothetical protein
VRHGFVDHLWVERNRVPGEVLLEADRLDRLLFGGLSARCEKSAQSKRLLYTARSWERKWKSRLRRCCTKMKTFLSCALLIASAGLMQASIIETISFNLSDLHAGSSLSGAFTLPNSPAVGTVVPVLLTFSDPSDYSPMSLAATITIGNGTPSGFAVLFSELTFTNPSGGTSPIDTKDVDLTGFAFAECASFPCTASGGFQDRSPAVFTSTYSIAPAAVPEPGFTLLVPILLISVVFGRRLVPPV